MTRLLLMALLLGLFLAPAVVQAATTQVIVITGSPTLGNECVTNFSMAVDLPDELILAWTPATNGNGTKIVLDYGEWPTNCNDGTVIYEGNGSSTTYIVDPDGFTNGIFVKAYAQIGNSCSSCYASGSAIASGEAAGYGVDMTGVDESLSTIADYIKVFFLLCFPLLLGMVGAVRHSLVGYLCGVIGFSIAIPVLDSALGLAVVIPASLFIVGLLGAAVRDALGEGLLIV